jgi:hypothetical protein
MWLFIFDPDLAPLYSVWCSYRTTFSAACNRATQLLRLVFAGMCSRISAEKLRSKEMLILKRSGGGGVGGEGEGWRSPRGPITKF